MHKSSINVLFTQNMTQRQMLTLLICFAYLSKIVIAVVNENNTGFLYGSKGNRG
jgi:hypothetical protein